MKIIYQIVRHSNKPRRSTLQPNREGAWAATGIHGRAEEEDFLFFSPYFFKYLSE